MLNKLKKAMTDIAAYIIPKQKEKPLVSDIENFLYIETKGNESFLICLKCEKDFSINPSDNNNQVWCEKKKVFVPVCPSCRISDKE